MSDTMKSQDPRTINWRRFEQNYKTLCDGDDIVKGRTTIRFPEAGINKLIYSFDVSCPGWNGGQWCSCHVNLSGEAYNPAHLTINGYGKRPKKNHWFWYDYSGRVKDGEPPHGHGKIGGKGIEHFHTVESDIKAACSWVIEQLYAGVYDKVGD
ncbi:hypothetical protein GXW71_32320 [Roseomonas hellenica]|uniref:Uncharacterized protein n=1 Tax=Plastoroseomonas hellenica TaxID=2687306 RepID=A0ABS5F934_9PROT|nr:hypothetical protein [Plastoroseomonas hellenica]MBR0669080.1 hypothetical protein [Plastoroseomonas hellenica]